MFANLGDRRIGMLVGPHRVPALLAQRDDVEIGGVALVGAMGRVLRAPELRHVNVGAGDILDRRIVRFAENQRVSRVGDEGIAGADLHSMRVALDRDGVVGVGDQDGAAGHGVEVGDVAEVSSAECTMGAAETWSPECPLQSDYGKRWIYACSVALSLTLAYNRSHGKAPSFAARAVRRARLDDRARL